MNKKIQILRGLAIIAVVLIHTSPSGLWQVCFRPFVNFAVAMFIFLSGYLTKRENENWVHFIKKRCLRVLIPYFIWTIVYTLPSFSFQQLAFNLVTTKSAYTLYYIFVYMQLVILTDISHKPMMKVLAMIGDYSFGIYLCHVLIINLLRTLTFYNSIPFVVNSLIVFCISFVMCFLTRRVVGDKISRYLDII